MKKTEMKNISLKSNDLNFDISKRQTLIGSAESCDIKIDHPSVSHYHALLITDTQGNMTLLDLKSKSGTYVSAQKIEAEQFVSVGDLISFGEFDLHVFESTEAVEFEDQDSHIEEVILDDKINIPVCLDENLIFIDDEYCNIQFDDNDLSIVDTSFMEKLNIASDEYQENDLEEQIYDIERFSAEDNAIKVTTTINGNILEQRVFPIGIKKVYAGRANKKDSIMVDLIDSKKELLFEVQGSQVVPAQLEGFELNNELYELSSEKPLIFQKGNYQIFIQSTVAPARMTNIPFWFRQKEFYKQTSTIFASLFIPFLALLLVNLDAAKQEPEKKLAIIYKKPTKTQVDKKQHTSQNVTSTKENTGHKKKTKNPKKIANSKAGAKTKKKTVPKKTKVAKKASKQKKTKVAKTKAPIKAYKFKLASNTKSLFQKSVKNVSANTSSNSRSLAQSAKSFTAGKISGTSSATAGNLGTDSSGAAQSFGSKGLSSRKGRDSSYIQTKTVVLGSMDPDLLRKILRRYMPQFQHCYQQELTYNSEDIKGVVDLNFKISGKGKVGGVRIVAKDKRFSKRGINCMKQVLSIIDFPAPKGGGTVAVRQPLNFFSDKNS